ncbi:hypothetical protein GGI25_006091 [Coemansia spiralis]|uniref:HhH-GPD domain-containing protein n=2 Tax=Coemansia TaxID=4863 RepID=A0A9W8FXH9_9FUNG|nr:hypothetical protein EDC05_004125 [Coemansia umbellata]KAJ2620754.1 hypothetical protein GGI26_004742 [Coemansia sp. RSA 1358]KAJ2669597.1 hypothetical protein GGI25_006091 [Coemansia spiralis]
MTTSARRSPRLLAKSAKTAGLAATASAALSNTGTALTASAGKVSKRKQNKRSNEKGKQMSTKTTTTTTAMILADNQTPSMGAVIKTKGLFQSLSDPGVMDEAVRYLKASDKKLALVIDATAEPCSMALSRDSDSDTSYISLCQSIIYQQLAGKAAEAILLRFLKRYGTPKSDAAKAALRSSTDASGSSSTAHPLSIKDFVFPSPQQVILFDVDEMRAIGLGQRKAEYLKEVAKNFSDGTLSEERLAAMSDEEVSRALVAIRGIGQWTADMFLMFHLKRPNVLPTLDLAVRKAMCHHFGVPFGKKTPTHEQMVELAQVWEPYRSVATWYMWRLIGTITQKS